MTPKTYCRYRWIIESKLWQETDIRAFRSQLRRNFNEERVQDLWNRFNVSAPYRISEEQSIKGLAWLKSSLFKIDGSIRQSKVRPFEVPSCELIREILADFSHWTFDKLVEVGTPGYYPLFAPVYTLHAKSGAKFSYSALPSETPEEY